MSTAPGTAGRNYLQGSWFVRWISQGMRKTSSLFRFAKKTAANGMKLGAWKEELRKRPVHAVSLFLLPAVAANGIVLALLHQKIGTGGTLFRLALSAIALLGLGNSLDIDALAKTSIVVKTTRRILRWKRS